MDLTFAIQRSEIPFPEIQAGLVVVPWKNSMIVFGGRMPRSRIYHHLSGEWIQKETNGDIPWKCPQLRCCTCSRLQQPQVINDQMFVLTKWGCEDDGGVLHILDLKTWTWKKVTPKGAPPARKSYAMRTWLYLGKLYFFGGEAWAELPENKDRNDEYPSYIKMHRWESRRKPGSPKIPGSNIHYYVNQLFCYNIEANSWEWPNVKGRIPSPRSDHLVIINGDKVFLAGGRGMKVYRDLHTLDMKSFEWKRIHGPIENGPLDIDAALRPHSAYTLTLISGSAAMLYGETGFSHFPQWADIYDDCWILHLNRALNNEEPASMWTRFRNHMPRSQHAAVLEPVTQRLWLIGGWDGLNSTKDVVRMTMNIVPLKILCFNSVTEHIRDGDEQLQVDRFPVEVKDEMSAYTKRKEEVLYCNQGNGCPICHNAMTDSDLDRRLFHEQVYAIGMAGP